MINYQYSSFAIFLIFLRKMFYATVFKLYIAFYYLYFDRKKVLFIRILPFIRANTSIPRTPNAYFGDFLYTYMVTCKVL